jgi:hypothetical protein
MCHNKSNIASLLPIRDTLQSKLVLIVIKTSLYYDARSEKHQIKQRNVLMEKCILWLPTVRYVPRQHKSGIRSQTATAFFLKLLVRQRADPCANEISRGEIETIIRVDWICVEALCNSCLTRDWFLLGKVPPRIRKKKTLPPPFRLTISMIGRLWVDTNNNRAHVLPK